MMAEPLTCELVDQHELDRRYVAGRLGDAEAAAFEQHYFGCDRCWALVKGGTAVRAAVAPPTAAAVDRGRWWKPLAIAAGLGVLAIGTWQVLGPAGPTAGDPIRGPGDSLAVLTERSGEAWRLVWPAAPDAASYRVRVFAEGGRLLLAREVADTSVGLPADSLDRASGGTPLYLEVEAFDLLQRPVVRSPLIPLRSRGDPR